MISIAIVIPTFNRKELLKTLLLQLREQEQEIEECRIYTIVVVDGSTDGTNELLTADFPWIHVVQGNGEWWYTKSMNEGFTYAESLKPDYVLTLNDDIEIDHRYIRALIDSLSKVEADSIIGSISYTFSTPFRITFSGIKNIVWWRYKIFPYHAFLTAMNPNQLKGIHETVTLPGRGMLIPLNILKNMNYFDEKFIQYASDEDFCLRARKKGVKTYISWDAIIYSHVNMTGTGTPFIKHSFPEFLKSFFSIYSRSYIIKDLRMIARHGNPILVPLTFFIVLLGNCWSFLKYKGDKPSCCL